MTSETLESLIARAQARDADAFDTLIDRFGPQIYGYLHRLCGSRTDAEDMLQEVFLRVVRRIDRYRHEEKFEGWIFKIATNLVRDRVRRIRRRPDHVSADASDESSAAALLVDPTAPAPDAGAQVHEEMDRLQSALDELPDAEREVVMLRHFSQLSFGEIADGMGTPLGTALARGHRGLAKLRALLEPNP